MIQTRTEYDDLENYLAGLDEQAEMQIQARRLEAYATGLTRGFAEGFGVAAIVGLIVVLLFRFLR